MFGLLSDRRAMVALEFAIAAPVLLLLLAGIVEMALGGFAGALLESALADASRFAATGLASPGTSREARLREIVAERGFGLFDPSRLEITSLVYPGFEDIGRPEPFTDLNGNGARESGEPFEDINGNGRWDPDMGRAGLGGPGDVVLTRVGYRWNMITPPLQALIGGLDLGSSVALRNEPF